MTLNENSYFYITNIKNQLFFNTIAIYWFMLAACMFSFNLNANKLIEI